MKKSNIICFLGLALISCQSNQASRSNIPDSTKANQSTVLSKNGIPVDFKFSLFISGAGAEDGTADSWTLDTNGIMVVHASRLIAPGKNQKLKGLAGVELVDMDTLRMLIWKGKLQMLDSMDLTQQCGGNEHFLMRIVPLSTDRPVTLSFDACAADFNLLTGDQRRYFKKFFEWWGRMRVKYRPAQAE